MGADFLEVEGLSKSYPAVRGREPLVVFEEVNFSIEKGEFVCIIGHSGCGKSTILNILAGLDEPSAGLVDEAMLLADKIMLMSNGPRARIAEIVQNTLPRDRNRHTVHKDPQYYPIRNHLVDFLVIRSKGFTEQPPAGYDPKKPPLVTPGLAATAPAIPESLIWHRAALKPVVAGSRY